jgi:hypothetical protein
MAGNDGSYRGPDLVAALMEGCGATDRWVNERLRALAKAGQLVKFVAPEDSKCGALTYALPDQAPLECDE